MASSSDPNSKMPTGLKIGLSILAGCGCLSVGTVVLGIIAAIALPSLLNQTHQIKASEAKTQIGLMNRANQAYFLEHEQFTADIQALGLNLPQQTEDYSYSILLPPTDDLPSVMATAVPLDNTAGLKSYIGAMYAVPDQHSDDLTTLAIICESDQPGAAPPEMPSSISSPAEIRCPPGSFNPGF